MPSACGTFNTKQRFIQGAKRAKSRGDFKRQLQVKMEHTKQAHLQDNKAVLGADNAAVQVTEPDEQITPTDESMLISDKIFKSYQHVVKQDMKFLESMKSYRTTVRHLNLKAQ